MDFAMDTLVTGRRIICLTCVDDIYEGVFNNNHSIRDFRCSGHAYSGLHCTVSRLSGDDKT